MSTKQLNIKNKSYYFYNDLINLSNFSMNNLKLDKKTWKDIDIYYNGKILYYICIILYYIMLTK